MMTDIDDRMRDTVMDWLDDESPTDTRALRAHAASMIRNAEEKLREERKVHYCLYESLHRCHEAITRFEAYGDIANHLAVGKAKNTLIMAESFPTNCSRRRKQMNYLTRPRRSCGRRGWRRQSSSLGWG